LICGDGSEYEYIGGRENGPKYVVAPEPAVGAEFGVVGCWKEARFGGEILELVKGVSSGADWGG
jgi:hypothetical protein